MKKQGDQFDRLEARLKAALSSLFDIERRGFTIDIVERKTGTRGIVGWASLGSERSSRPGVLLVSASVDGPQEMTFSKAADALISIALRNRKKYGKRKATKNPNRNPEGQANETQEFYQARIRRADRWVPASGGHEQPFKSRSGKRLLYVWNAKTGEHAYLDMDSDLILTPEEATMAIGLNPRGKKVKRNPARRGTGAAFGTYSLGKTPKKAIVDAFNYGGGKSFDMSLRGVAAKALVRIVNVGIDSHLEGVTGSTFGWEGDRLICSVPLKDLLVILRRLLEDGKKDALGLRDAMLQSMEIEEV